MAANSELKLRSEAESVEPILGTRAKFSSALEIAEELRLLKFKRLKTVWSWLGQKKDPKTDEVLSFGDRPGKCLAISYRSKEEASLPQPVDLIRGETGAWSLRGMVTCGSGWVCPRCAEVKSRKACAEVGAAIHRHLKGVGRENNEGMLNDVAMATLTLPHSYGESQRAVIDRINESWKLMTKTRQWRKFVARWGIVGRLRVMEATFGRHGIHPHFHVALFMTDAQVRIPNKGFIPIRYLDRTNRKIENQINAPSAAQAEMRELTAHGGAMLEIESQILPMWEKAVSSLYEMSEDRRATFRDKAVKVNSGEHAAAYFTKWGMAEEMTRGGVKGSLTQWGLLDLMQEGDAVAGVMFCEFYRATKGLSVMTGLAALRKSIGLTDEHVKEHVERRARQEEKKRKAEGGPAPEEYEELELTIPHALLSVAVRVGWAAVLRQLNIASRAKQEEQHALIKFLVQERGGTEKGDGIDWWKFNREQQEKELANV